MGDNQARRDQGEQLAADIAAARAQAPPVPQARHVCRYCHRPVMWTRTAARNKLMPLDPEPNPAGNVELTTAGAVVHGQPPLLVAELYMPHFATCPSWPTDRARST